MSSSSNSERGCRGVSRAWSRQRFAAAAKNRLAGDSTHETAELQQHGRLPLLVRRALEEAGQAGGQVSLSFWRNHAEQALQQLSSLLPVHVALLLHAYACAGVRHPPLAAAAAAQFLQVLSRQRALQHPSLLMRCCSADAAAGGGGGERPAGRAALALLQAQQGYNNSRARARHEELLLQAREQQQRQRLQFGAVATLLLALERLQLLHHPLVASPASGLLLLLLSKVQGHCSSFTFQHLKQLLLLLARLSLAALPTVTAPKVHKEHKQQQQPLGDHLRQLQQQRQQHVRQQQHEEVGLRQQQQQQKEMMRQQQDQRETGVAVSCRWLCGVVPQGLVLEVMQALADKLQQHQQHPRPAGQQQQQDGEGGGPAYDGRDMLLVAWCVARMDRLFFTAAPQRNISAATAAAAAGEEEGKREALTKGEKAAPSGDDEEEQEAPADAEQAYQDDEIEAEEEDEVGLISEEELLLRYARARFHVLASATTGIRTMIICRLRCPPLEAALALHAYCLFSDTYMRTKLELYLSFLLAEATLEDLLAVAEGLRLLRVAQPRVWNVWLLHARRFAVAGAAPVLSQAPAATPTAADVGCVPAGSLAATARVVVPRTAAAGATGDEGVASKAAALVPYASEPPPARPAAARMPANEEFQQAAAGELRRWFRLLGHDTSAVEGRQWTQRES